MEEPKTVTVGKTTVDIDEVVRDPRGIRSLIAEIISDEKFGWPERKLQQIDCKLKIFPSARDLKEWDRILLERYPPIYAPPSTECTSCTLGTCDLSRGKGACGMDLKTKCAVESLLNSCKGASVQLSHARELVNEAIKRFGKEKEISHGRNVRYPSINPSVLVGFNVYTLEDAEKALSYGETQLAELLTSAEFGSEGDVLDLECKAFHAGSISFLAAEIAEIVKESCFGLCSSSNAELVELPNFPHFIDQGVGTIDRTKPVILFAGNSILPGIETIDYVREKGEEVQICGVGPAGLDLGRYYEGTKNLGSALKILKVIRCGIPDVIVLGDVCINLNVREEAEKAGIPVISSSPKLCMGYEDRTEEDISKIVSNLVEGTEKGIIILDPKKVAEVAVLTSKKISETRKKDILPKISEYIEKCDGCGKCEEICPNLLPLTAAVRDEKKLSEIYDSCLFCARCESVCPKEMPIMSLILKSAEEKMREEKYRMRPGRGTPTDLEFRDVAFAFGFGTVSGMVAIVGCAGYPGSAEEVGYMVNELVDMNYLVLTAGCTATEIASYYNQTEKKHIYEAWHSLFQIRGFLNCGSCSALSHVARGFYKYTHVIARTPINGNFVEQADYIFGKLPCAVIMWGPVTEQMYAAAAAFARMGAPVVLGPHGSKYSRFFLGNRDDRSKWWCYDGFTGRKLEVEPCPPHLIVPVETKEEALTMVTRLLFRPNDFRDGRMSKFDSYLSFYERYFKGIPDDFPLFVRAAAELPWTRKHKLLRILREKHGWETEKGVIIRAKHRDGRLLTEEEYADSYGIRVGQYSTFLERLILKEAREKR
ncbi:MAG: 4Fe-4S dicluster domain-containing protein [Candidatus Syntropharchaeia archaeon]